MSPSTFAPDDPITRAQLAVILYNYTQQFAPGSLTETGSLTGFPDAGSVPSWARTAMAWAVGNGLISGVKTVSRTSGRRAALRALRSRPFS